MDCKQIEERLSDYIENELSPELSAQVSKHLDQCSECSRILDSMVSLIHHGQDLSEDVPFYLKNRLLYIPEMIEIQEEKPNDSQNLKWIAAMVAGLVLLLNIFYFTNVYPEGHIFLHKTVAKIERFAIDTKEYLFKKESFKNNFLLSFLDKNVFSNDEKDYLTYSIRNKDENG